MYGLLIKLFIRLSLKSGLKRPWPESFRNPLERVQHQQRVLEGPPAQLSSAWVQKAGQFSLPLQSLKVPPPHMEQIHNGLLSIVSFPVSYPALEVH